MTLGPTCRWTIVRKLSPMPRRASDPTRNRPRAHVRCVCGFERVLWLEEITQGRSSGCNSHRCRARFEAARDVEAMLGSRFVAAHKLHDRLARWLSESGRRDRLEMREALEGLDDDDDDAPPTRACVR